MKVFQDYRNPSDGVDVKFHSSHGSPDRYSKTHGACPVCKRDHDTDCRWFSDLKTVLCYTKAKGGSSSVVEPPDEVNGYKWVNRKLTKDGRCAIYILDENTPAIWKKPPREPKPETYLYHDADGKKIVKVEKYYKDGEKKFSQYRLVDQQWVKGTNPIKEQIPLYNLPAVLKAVKSSEAVYFVEGESCANALKALGLTATSLIGGAEKLHQYNPAALNVLKGAVVILCPDRDQPGVRHMDEVAEALKGVAASIQWLYAFPDDSDRHYWERLQENRGADVKDWIDELKAAGESDSAVGQAIGNAIGAKRLTGANSSGKRKHPEDGEIGLEAEPNHWKAPESHNYERGVWRFVDGAEFKVGAVPEKYEGANFRCIPAKIKDPDLDEEGKVKKGFVDGLKVQEFTSLLDLDFYVTRFMESPEGGAFQFQVERLFGNRLSVKKIVIQAADCSKPDRFLDALKRSLKSNVCSLLKPDDLQRLVHSETQKYFLNGGKTYRLTDRVGCQEDGYWVFKNVQFTPDGEVCTEETSHWVYNENLGADDGIDSVPHPVIQPPNKNALRELLLAQEEHFGDNFYQAVLCNGFVAAGVNDRGYMAANAHFPILNLNGDAGSGKTHIALSALSLVGLLGDKGSISHASESSFYELAKSLGSVPFLWDDPERSPEVDCRLKNYYNRFPRRVRGNVQQPHAALIVSSNHAVGEGNAAAASRMIWLHVPRHKNSGGKAQQRLKDAMEAASGALPDLIRIGYPKEQLKALQLELAEHLGAAHERLPENLALITFYSQKIVEMAGMGQEVNIKQWVITHLCKAANENQSGLDSVSDFLEKLCTLRTQDQVGAWNLAYRGKNEPDEGRRGLYVYMPDAWDVFNRRFQPIYSRSILEQALQELGALKEWSDTGKKIQRKFNASRDETLSYRRMQLGAEPQPKDSVRGKPATVPRKCLFIPESILVSSGILWYPEEDTAETLGNTGVSTSGIPVSSKSIDKKERKKEEKGEHGDKTASQKNGVLSRKNEDTRIPKPKAAPRNGSSGIQPRYQLDSDGYQDTDLTPAEEKYIDLMGIEQAAVIAEYEIDEDCEDTAAIDPATGIDVVSFES
ncbi:hypothetical protein H6G00_00365 [Leptolyngbya sp. FACHB-541]|uniref:hypothetical protein n=1 Tax=Leptolyngbya sp. FACHB-541 TaxID=2692810 RepID=UPI001684B1ED|nr:hypothetical protein [Leptolyngbya sp. FACHB-541]MBD1995082.1 hypothetical protein [Leptolyngbya sp. FACHB-541]